MSKFSFRWGIKDLDDGFVPVYNFMLRNYTKAGVTRSEFLLILHLASYRYESDIGKATPSQDSIAEQMGYAHRNSIMRLVSSLREKGMLKTEGSTGFPLEYDFSGFSSKVSTLWYNTISEVQPTVCTPCTSKCAPPAHPSVHEEKKEEKEKEIRAPRKRNELFDTIALCGFGISDTSKMNGSAGRVGKIIKALKGIEPSVSHDDAKSFYSWWKTKYPDATPPRDADKFTENWLAWRQGSSNKQPSLSRDPLD